MGWRREVRFLRDPLLELEVGGRKLELRNYSGLRPPNSELQLTNAPVCCDGIGNLTFNQVSFGRAGSIPVRSAF